ncbi:FAD-binding and (Fe-S)-binding domain-containing protein [Agriterribacter sp.]|uniref:FAD-binding and (Fe-S)-binding domain-containing protein n=1 Tax=Agriterribacter sp. TaxID=2821509 RepID=UPI002D16D909|nr:FAD-linked oxidase C-terminal domain-containing protein [Agriterribacter sp.]HTN06859.1 FAD-linked oxidase C-terminal domain-containing protein [Agriterribacter sp.]
MMTTQLAQLSSTLEGELYSDKTIRTLYATDASAYREMPLAVAMPRSVADIKKLIAFAHAQKTALIPRTAGTSLAGQVVGNGIVVDVSKYFTRVLELNAEEHWVRVQPGVIRDELNLFLKPHGLFFGPETSTANRAMIGGMVGNNSCGSNSIVYRSTREHLLEIKALLSDGSEAVFKAMDIDAFHAKCEAPDLEGKIYRSIRGLLSNYNTQEEIRKEFPKKTVERRNTGYAVDMLLDTAPFTAGEADFNFCKLIAGSEGTLAFITEIKLNVVPLPKEAGLLCVHFNTIDESLRANLIGLKYKPSASELIDHYILECTKDNIEQSKNRFFVQGDPGAILVIEFTRNTRAEITAVAQQAEAEMRAAGLGYYFPLLFGEDTKKIWTLRKAGLGLLSNLPGDDKAVPVIEDTAVDVNDLPAYIREFNDILKKYNLYSVHYAHAGSGEIHLRPIINLKTKEGNLLFRTIAEEIATLVKKYKGSLSGEHGDGRLRGEFIRQMIGEKNYELLKAIKKAWDPNNIFNPNKIVDTPAMNTMLRYEPGRQMPAFKTIFRYPNQDVLQHAEQCNGSGDCRKTHLSGGTMCPSYMATKNEKDTTRARANILREFLTHSDKINRFDHKEIYEVMDLCLSCKGCKSECPSNVDVAKLKAEFLQQYFDANGVPLRSRLIGNFTALSKAGAMLPGLYNLVMTGKLTAGLVKRIAGFAPGRSMPEMYKITLRRWYKRHRQQAAKHYARKVYLFCDEFTNYNDTETGIKAILLLEQLGYEVIIPEHIESGRSWLSKGLLRKAKTIAEKNVRLLSPLINEQTPLIGIEPSAILTFRDEYIDLADDAMLEETKRLSANVFTIEEFLSREADAGNITGGMFTKEQKKIVLHGHCHQKALSSTAPSVKILSLPQNYAVQIIPSGCCGMAGSFGYEKEHYDLSMQIGELVLLPAVRKQAADVIIAAPGTSCRHQIKDGASRKALHPVEILYDALADVERK